MLLVLSAAQVKEGGRRFAAVVAQTWNVTDAAAPTLQRQVSLYANSTIIKQVHLRGP